VRLYAEVIIGCVSAEQQITGVLLVARRTAVARRDSMECVCMRRGYRLCKC